MGKNTKSKGSPNSPPGMATRQTGDGSFEIVVDGEDAEISMNSSESSERSVGKPETSGRRWVAAATICAVLFVGGAGAAMLVFEEDADKPGLDESVMDENAPGFQPYSGGSIQPSNTDSSEESSEPSRSAGNDRIVEREVDAEKGESENDNGFENRRAPHRDERDPALRREPDGVEIVEDTRGVAMSQREAQERLRRELDSIENAENDFEQRLRRRDVELNSRVMRRHAGSIQTAPGVQVSDEIQQRIQQNFKLDPSAEKQGVDADEYRQDEYYDDEYWDEDDDYYDPEPDDYWDDDYNYEY